MLHERLEELFQRYRNGSSATFFEDNYVADVLNECRPAEVTERLASALSIGPEHLLADLRERYRSFL